MHGVDNTHLFVTISVGKVPWEDKRQLALFEINRCRRSHPIARIVAESISINGTYAQKLIGIQRASHHQEVVIDGVSHQVSTLFNLDNSTLCFLLQQPVPCRVIVNKR